MEIPAIHLRSGAVVSGSGADREIISAELVTIQIGCYLQHRGDSTRLWSFLCIGCGFSELPDFYASDF